MNLHAKQAVALGGWVQTPDQPASVRIEHAMIVPGTSTRISDSWPSLIERGYIDVILVVQGDESVWIDEEGNRYDWDEQGEKIVKLKQEWLVTAVYADVIDSPQAYETIVEADDADEAERIARIQAIEDNGAMYREDLDDLNEGPYALTDVFARPK